MDKIKKILIDNCIESLSMVMVPALKEQEIQWGNRKQTIKIVGYVRKPTLPPNEKWKQYQVDCLPTVARLTRDKQLDLYIYNEILFEGWQRPGGFPRNTIGNIFNGIEFNHCNAPIERSRIFQTEIGKYIQRNQVIDYCKFLIHSNVEILAENPAIQQRFPQNELNNLRNVSRYRDLCKGLSEKHYPDALHLWAAEVNGLDYFLTTDHRFINAMIMTKKIELSCKPISPEDLLKVYSISELDPFPFEQDQFYTVFGTPG